MSLLYNLRGQLLACRKDTQYLAQTFQFTRALLITDLFLLKVNAVWTLYCATTLHFPPEPQCIA